MTIDVTGGSTPGGDDDHDGQSVCGLPTLEDLISQARAARTESMAVSKANQEERGLFHKESLKGGLSAGDRAAEHHAGASSPHRTNPVRDGSLLLSNQATKPTIGP